MTAWSLVYEGYDPEQEGLRESLCALGNGYFVSRGSAPDSAADGIHYPGSYVAGGHTGHRRKLVVLFHDDGIISQFEGYEEARLGGARGALWRHPAPGPAARGRGRHAEPVRGL